MMGRLRCWVVRCRLWALIAVAQKSSAEADGELESLTAMMEVMSWSVEQRRGVAGCLVMMVRQKTGKNGKGRDDLGLNWSIVK
ncbi:hypothetical protein M0R45_019764 [Rubus argutus]|uniref:Secreted protein n=1 Tax=Rubus argutus TaxID=59490 RepID=A0AAW1X8B4_RUBAR